MIKDEDTNVFMSLGGPLIPGGMRNIVSQNDKGRSCGFNRIKRS